MFSLKRLGIASLLVLASVSVALAQANAKVSGTITDPNGAAVPGAVVKLLNQATKIEVETTTNESGYFNFVNVNPAMYSLRVELQGFKGVHSAPFNVGVNEAVVQDIALTVGAVSETVEITAGAELIQQASSDLGTVIPEKVVQDLPLNGRNFTQLLTLTPGVTPVSTSQNRNVGGVEGNVGIPGSGFADPSFHGQPNRSKLYFFDGIINTNVRGPTYIVIPNIDLVQEFKVVGHDARVDYGGAMGGVVNMVSKAGGRNFHGSAFEYVRNDAFDARNPFDVCTKARCKPGQGVPDKPLPFRQNQFGATLTGPIFRNHTFFSVGYDGWRYSQPTLALAYVPTAAEINGDFTNTPFRRRIFNPYSTRLVGNAFVRDEFRCDASGVPLPVDAQKRQNQALGAPCFKIPQALIFAPMQNFFRTYSPTPNLSGDPTNNFAQIRPSTNNSNSFQVRIDHRFSDSDNVFFRYTQQNVTVFNPLGNEGSTGGSGKGRNYGGAWTHTFSPNLMFDIRAGYAGRPGVDSSQQNQHEAGVDTLTQNGFLDVDKYDGLLVTLANWTAGGNNNFGVRGAALRENPNWSVTPSLTWLRGNHSFKMGGWYLEAKRVQLNTFQTYVFNDEQTRNPTLATGTSGLSLASALLGFPNNFNAQLPVLHGGPVQFKYGSWAAFIQDEWRVKRNFSLTLGLRYDYLTQPKTTDGRLWNSLDLENQKWIIGATEMPGLCSAVQSAPCIPDAFRNDAHFANVVLAGKQFFAPPPIKDNWGPRIGIAWTLNPRTVIRAGYGLYWDALPARSQYAQNDLEATVWPDATAFAGTANASAAFTNGTAANIIQIQGQGFATPLPTTNPWSLGGFPNNPNYKDPYSQQWHVEVQRELTTTSMFSIAYVGSKNGRLPYAGFANAARQASPNGTPNSVIDALRLMPWVSAGITYTTNTGYSNYNALESKFQRRFSRGLSTLISYTWSKSIDVSSGYFNVENGPGGGSTIQNYFDPSTARGVSGYDIPHFLSWATVYELPLGKGKRWFRDGPGSWILGNWQTNFIMQARSGAPFNLQVTGDLANLRGSAPTAPGNYLRPNLIADPFVPGPVAANPDPACQRTISQGGKAADQVRTIASWFNPCAFGIPSGSFGSLGRNAFRGKSVFNTDLSLFKSFPIRENWQLQLRVETFNVFNIQNWDTPAAANLILNTNATTLATNVGRISTLAAGTNPRQIQFGIRLNF
ncbi:MAG TPA: carboxypeptidase regulatory-like domain-containing protein [Pyrinomonadaceae bacterium]|nr:carboxypeptidase regulatory-like domain-containing protein [Pyrinomonadaceae bacterium]